MPNLCQVTFTGDDNAPRYSYYCNGLTPSVGDWVAVPVGKNQSIKIVKCVALSDEPWTGSFPLKEVWGIVHTRTPGEPMPIGG